jgi:hypothetical protein
MVRFRAASNDIVVVVHGSVADNVIPYVAHLQVTDPGVTPVQSVERQGSLSAQESDRTCGRSSVYVGRDEWQCR